MYQIDLLDHTDHYIPILKKEVSKKDLEELKAGLERTNDSRIKRMTVFDRGDIYKENFQVKNLLDSSGVYTDKIANLDALKWKLLVWLSENYKTLFSPQSISIKDNLVTINNNPVASVSSIDDSGYLGNLASQIGYQETDVRDTLKNDSKNDEKILKRVEDTNLKKTYLGLDLAIILNGWTSDIISLNSSCQETVRKCSEIDNEVRKLLHGSMSKEDAIHIKDLLLTKEKLELNLVKKGIYPPLLLLNTQLTLVGLLDSYLSKEPEYREFEDSLFIRIVDGVDNVGLINDWAEKIRMNLGNMHNIKENYVEADNCYRKAIKNLKTLDDHSVRVERLITIVYNHLFHMELERGNENSYDTLLEFREHVSELDELNDSFLVDRCMYVTAELTQIDIADDSLYDVVESAMILYEEAKNFHSINDIYSEAFIDVMIYMPQMIARYHIDHFPETGVGPMNEYFEKAELYLNEAYDNCERFKEIDYRTTMFLLGEIQHNRGFLYGIKIEKWGDSEKAYLEAYDWRLRYFNNTKEPSSEIRIAQTLVNIGGLEQKILSLVHPTKEQLNISISRVDQAINIYRNHLSKDNPNGELEYHEALQLKATILDLLVRENPGCTIAYNEAMNNYFLCWNWNKKHPNNQYRRCFVDISGRILKERNFITKEEYEDVKKEMGL